MDKRDELRLGFETAYIDGSVASNSFYSPQFVSNNYKDGKKVLSSIEDELLRCDKFQISVAFITLGGITPLLQTLKELEKKNIPGEILTGLSQDLLTYGKSISKEQQENIINVMTNEFPAGSGKKTYSQCVFIEKEGNDYKPTKTFLEMLSDRDFYNVIKELVDFGISRYERDYKQSYDVTDFVLYQKYTNEDHFVPEFRDRLIAISKSGRSLQSEDVQNFLKAKERAIRVELFVRKNKDDKISKEFYYLGHMTASGNTKEFTMPNTQKTAVEIEWILDVPVREDIYEYIVNS